MIVGGRVKFVDVGRQYGDPPPTQPLHRLADGIVRADNGSARFSRNVADQCGFTVGAQNCSSAGTGKSDDKMRFGSGSPV